MNHKNSLRNLYSEVLEEFPKQRSLVFAYGSGVFEQDNNEDMSKNMTDFIIAVENSQQWHQNNLEVHPHHYSGLAKISGAKKVAWLQDGWGAKFYFNTLVPWRDKGRIKYGIISSQNLVDDLCNWSTLYAAGRLHKPVKILECSDHLRPHLHKNLKMAVTTSLLLLPESFSEEELFMTIAGLSYTGDFRMTVGEDRNKVSNIVRPQLNRFKELYSGPLAEVSNNFHRDSRGQYKQDISPPIREEYFIRQTFLFIYMYNLECFTKKLTRLPNNLQRTVKTSENFNNNIESLSEMNSQVNFAIGKIVAATDKSQAIKGILTAGLTKTIIYSFAKLKKMLRSIVH